MAVVDGLTVDALDSLKANQRFDYSVLLQALRQDVVSCVRHLSVFEEDVWARLAIGSELASTLFEATYHNSDVVLIVIVRVQNRSDCNLLISTLLSTASTRKALQRSSAFVAALLRRHSDHLRLAFAAPRAVDVRLADAGTVAVLQNMQYVSSANTLEDALALRNESSSARTSSQSNWSPAVVLVTQDDIDQYVQDVEEEAAQRSVQQFDLRNRRYFADSRSRQEAPNIVYHSRMRKGTAESTPSRPPPTRSAIRLVRCTPPPAPSPNRRENRGRSTSPRRHHGDRVFEYVTRDPRPAPRAVIYRPLPY